MDAEEQRKQVWSGCQSILGCGGLIAFFALVYFVAGFALRHSTSKDAIVFMDAKLVQNAIFAGGLFAAAALFIALAAMKTRGLVITLVAIIAIAYLGLYRPFAAIKVSGDTIALQYVWPRPATVLHRSDITSVTWRMTTRLSNDLGETVYVLELHSRGGTYQSFDDANFGDIQEVERLLNLRHL